MGVKLPSPLTSRAATIDDARTVVDLANAASRFDIGIDSLDLDDVRTAWESPTIDLELDTVIVLDGERVVAAAELDEERAEVEVHPDARGRGIGSALVTWTERRARERGAARIGQTVLADLDGAQQLFADRGYERLWQSWVLVFPGGYERPDIAIRQSDGEPQIHMRAYRAGDERAVYEVVESAFNEWPNRDARTFEEWQRMTTRRSIFDPGLVVVATQNEEIVGAAIGVRYESEGFVDQVAVAPAHRNRGVARALIARLYDEFRSRGEDTIRLNTDSRTGALQLYLDIGMTLETTYECWSLPLAPTAVEPDPG